MVLEIVTVLYSDMIIYNLWKVLRRDDVWCGLNINVSYFVLYEYQAYWLVDLIAGQEIIDK